MVDSTTSIGIAFISLLISFGLCMSLLSVGIYVYGTYQTSDSNWMENHTGEKDVVLYTDEMYTGQELNVPIVSTATTNVETQKNSLEHLDGKVRSVYVPPHYELTLYTGKDFKGQALTIYYPGMPRLVSWIKPWEQTLKMNHETYFDKLKNSWGSQFASLKIKRIEPAEVSFMSTKHVVLFQGLNWDLDQYSHDLTTDLGKAFMKVPVEEWVGIGSCWIPPGYQLRIKASDKFKAFKMEEIVLQYPGYRQKNGVGVLLPLNYFYSYVIEKAG
jgi:hypothetical protein